MSFCLNFGPRSMPRIERFALCTLLTGASKVWAFRLCYVVMKVWTVVAAITICPQIHRQKESIYFFVLGIPVEEIEKTENLAVVLTERGGHVAFVDTFFARGDSYVDRMFEQYVTAVFNNQDLLKQKE